MVETVKIHDSWRGPLGEQFGSADMMALKTFLVAEKAAGKTIFPKGSQYFRALDLTPLDQVRVVILGQDPYHGPGQAHGLCFSVQPGVRPPPSLQNIFKELERDLGIPQPGHGFLEHWAMQGVLLLNAVLTVEMGLAGSHQGRGWEAFTDAIIRLINAKTDPVVFMLWGSHAQKKASFVNAERHLVLKSVHPSPLSAHRGFLGCGHFGAANAFLLNNGTDPIDWSLPPVDFTAKAPLKI
jgi:uracil-DNA glycosylase